MLHHFWTLVKKKKKEKEKVKYTMGYLNLYSSCAKAHEILIHQQWSLTNAKIKPAREALGIF